MKKRTNTYILVDGHPLRCTDIGAWLRWLEHSHQERQVKKTQLGTVNVSTLFLGFDCNATADGPPWIYETTVHGGELHRRSWLCSTKEQASLHHDKIVAQIQEAESTRH